MASATTKASRQPAGKAGLNRSGLYLAMGMLGAVLASGMGASPAHATACCLVRPTADGFLAMRAGPGARFQLLKKIPSGDAVCFGSPDPDAPNTGNWTYGFYTDASSRTYYGWVNARYLEKECG